MIPNKNLFNGALGKAQDVGGSRCFSVPHTIDVPVQYSINSNLIGDFISCSLNGLLWCLKRSTRLTFFGLRWNSDTLQLEFATSLALSNEIIITRGLDWFLTKRYFIVFQEGANNISAFKLFDDDSILKSSEEGVIDYPYSFLPPIGDFQLIGNFLLRRSLHENMILPLIPLGGNPLDDFTYDVASLNWLCIHHDSSLWGYSSHRLGKLSLIPAVLGHDNIPQCFYLMVTNGASNIPEGFAPTFFGNHLFASSLDNINHLCLVSNNSVLLNTDTSESISFSDNGRFFFDPFSASGFVLDDNSITILRDNSTRLECNSLPQWVAPAGNIDAIDSDLIFGSSDNLTFVTHTEQGFFRELLHDKIMPISTPHSSGYRFSFGLHSNESNRNVLDVNQIHSSTRYENYILEENVLHHDLITSLLSEHNLAFYYFLIDYSHDSMPYSLLFLTRDISCSVLRAYDNYQDTFEIDSRNLIKRHHDSAGQVVEPDVVLECSADIWAFLPELNTVNYPHL